MFIFDMFSQLVYENFHFVCIQRVLRKLGSFFIQSFILECLHVIYIYGHKTTFPRCSNVVVKLNFTIFVSVFLYVILQNISKQRILVILWFFYLENDFFTSSIQLTCQTIYLNSTWSVSDCFVLVRHRPNVFKISFFFFKTAQTMKLHS